MHDTLSDDLFQKFSVLIYEKAGIYLKAEKKELLTARLGKRLRFTGINTFKEYYDYIIKDQNGQEFTNFINGVSTNFTSFFRESSHFDFLIATILPSFVAAGRREIKFWSAACSSGEEPYTLAVVMEEYFQNNPRIPYNILATDISTKVLNIAEQGVYPVDRAGKIPSLLLKKYFRKGVGNSSGYVKAKDELKRLITFKQLNLMGNFPWQEKIDVIFCRNVMIYFDRQTQEKLINKFYDCITPGGYLLIGHSESISSIKHKFVQREATSYQK